MPAALARWLVLPPLPPPCCWCCRQVGTSRGCSLMAPCLCCRCLAAGRAGADREHGGQPADGDQPHAGGTGRRHLTEAPLYLHASDLHPAQPPRRLSPASLASALCPPPTLPLPHLPRAPSGRARAAQRAPAAAGHALAAAGAQCTVCPQVRHKLTALKPVRTAAQCTPLPNACLLSRQLPCTPTLS